MVDDLNVFHIMQTMRPMRRLKPDPVPQDVIEKVLDAGIWAPNSLNSQPYCFLVVRDVKSKALFGERYDAAMTERFASMVPDEDDDSPSARKRNSSPRWHSIKSCGNFPRRIFGPAKSTRMAIGRPQSWLI